MIIAISLFLFFAFAFAATYLSFKNNFSLEMEDILFKAAGAVAVATYFLFLSLVISSPRERTFQVPIPTMYDPESGRIFSPYSISARSLPEEGNMFKGLSRYNTTLLYNNLRTLEFWEDLRKTSETLHSLGRLEYLEFVVLEWLESEVNWLKISDLVTFSHAGHSRFSPFEEATASSTSNQDLSKIANPNRFFLAKPLMLTLPKNTVIKRSRTGGAINLTLLSRTGEFSIDFFGGSGGIFDQRIPTNLILNLGNMARQHLGPTLPERLWADYPIVKFRYRPFRLSRYSDQAKREENWIKKIESRFFIDFSWDLLREYLSFDYQAALALARSRSNESDGLQVWKSQHDGTF